MTSANTAAICEVNIAAIYEVNTAAIYDDRLFLGDIVIKCVENEDNFVQKRLSMFRSDCLCLEAIVYV